MDETLKHDQADLPELLDEARTQALDYIRTLPDTPPGPQTSHLGQALPRPVPARGSGGLAALQSFQQQFGHLMPAFAGPRYFGFVIGGALPAAVAGDWLAAAYDQNAFQGQDSASGFVEREVLARIRELLALPPEFIGTLTTGGTMSNFTNLAIAREWAGSQNPGLGNDRSVAQEGIGATRIVVLGGEVHSSSIKSLALLGLGRDCFEPIGRRPGREALDPRQLEERLAYHTQAGAAVIVNAAAGTVNTGDFDDLRAIAELKQRYSFWLHVDGAFGGFVRLSNRHTDLLDGLEAADSITLDAHKWLNVPHDCGIQFSRRRDLQVDTFANSAAYLGRMNSDSAEFMHLTPENSRRFRALPLWLALEAYGREGYVDIVERGCDNADALAAALSESPFRLLAPVYSNVVCFSWDAAGGPVSAEERDAFLKRLTERGRVFVSATTHAGEHALRAAFVNWSTTMDDVEILANELRSTLAELRQPA